jgi:hypothetical protein
MTKPPQSPKDTAGIGAASLGQSGTAGNQMLVAALAYARRGWHVLPCRTGDKRPATTHGFKDATTDKATLIRFWSNNPNANVGIATGRISGLVVLDVDPRNGGDSQLQELQRVHGDLPDTLVAATGGGGSHYFFKAPEGGLASGVLAPGLDLKAEGGYVVAAPSVHPGGETYRWARRAGEDTASSMPRLDCNGHAEPRGPPVGWRKSDANLGQE